MDNDTDNIYSIGKVGLSPKRSYHTGCKHRTITVHEHTRNLECDGCGKIISAFDYMYEWANKQQKIIWRNETLYSQIKDREKTLLDLTRKITNIKARIRASKVKLDKNKELI